LPDDEAIRFEGDKLLRRMLVVAVLAFTALPAFAAAPVFQTPKALLTYIYAGYSTGKFPDDNDVFYSRSLNALFAAAGAATPAGDVGPIDFDVFTNAQDYKLTELKIGAATPEGQGEEVKVSFKNFGEAQTLLYHLVDEDGGWKITDIDCQTPGQEWTLSKLLTAPQDGGGSN
jgi:hypothetical protein